MHCRHLQYKIKERIWISVGENLRSTEAADDLLMKLISEKSRAQIVNDLFYAKEWQLENLKFLENQHFINDQRTAA